MSQRFTHLHVHTSYSALSSTIHLEQLFERAKSLGMDAVALTDHGNLCGAIDFLNEAKKHGIKPIFGCDIYLELLGSANANERHKYSRLVLLAKDQKGFKNLSLLISRSYTEGRGENRPIIKWDWLKEMSEGIFALYGGLRCESAYHLLHNRDEEAKKALKELQKIFGKSLYVSIQQTGIPEQAKVSEWLIQEAKQMKIELVATADVHYLDREDNQAQEVLSCIQLGRTISDTGRRRLCNEFWFKDQATMAEQFAAYPAALENANIIADACNVSFKFTDDKGRPVYYLPDFKIPPEENVKTLDDYLKIESDRGLEWRFKQPSFQKNLAKPDWPELEKQYRARLADEVSMINKTGFAGYFLIVADFIKWAKRNDIPVGPGRGSGAGSLVAWALSIIDIDPVPYNLLFERFINPERVSLPDFDVDFCQDRRGEVIEYVREKYGKEQVAQIITFGKLQTKQCIRDVGRVLGMPYGEVDTIAKLVPERLGITLEEALAEEPKFAELRSQSPTIDQLFTHALKIEGLIRSYGKHAAGVIITDKPITDYAPLYTDEDGTVVIQYDKDAAEKVGLVKFDFLGLKTLTYIQHASNMINERRPADQGKFRIEDTGVDDPFSYQLIARGDTSGIFQVESSGMTELCKKMMPANLEEVTLINALYRPGPLESGMVDDFIERKHGRVSIEYPVPQLEDVLRESFGVFIYQEQVMRAARVLAGYSLGEADLLRRAMGKKKPEEMAKQKDRFVKGALERGISEEKSSSIFDLMEKFSGYGFNKSHATAYAYISYQTAYLKAHYPAENFAALLTTEMSNTDKLAVYIADAKSHDIKVLGPDVNQSSRFFNVIYEGEKPSIRFGLEAIKNVGGAAVEEILGERSKKGPFRSFADFCKRVQLRKVNKKTLETLIKVGAFDSFMENNKRLNRATLFKNLDNIMVWAGKEQEREALGQGGLFDFASSNGPSLITPEPEYDYGSEWPHDQKLTSERDLLGFYVSGHPLDPHESVLRRCVTTSVARLYELWKEGKLPKRGPEDWKAKKEARNREPSLGGLLTSVKEITSKKGDRMAFLTLEDFTGKIEAICFARTWEKVKTFAQQGQIVVIRGQAEPNDAGVKILVSSLEPLSNLAESSLKDIRMVIFKLDPKRTSREQLQNLHLLCSKHKGTCRGMIEFTNPGDGVKATFQLPEELKFSADMGFVQEVREIFGGDVLSFV